MDVKITTVGGSRSLEPKVALSLRNLKNYDNNVGLSSVHRMEFEPVLTRSITASLRRHLNRDLNKVRDAKIWGESIPD